jgi:hypothetical protein
MTAERLFTVVLLGVASLAACQGDADFSDVAPKTITLSAEEYQTDIMAIDRLVFEEKSFSSERRSALAAMLQVLAKRIREKMDSRFLELESLELRRLAEMAKRLDSDSSRASFANQWMRIRSNLFDDRAWFARSAADFSPIPAPGSADRLPQR